MKKITILIVTAVLCLNFRIYGQQSSSFKPLKPGDTFPSITINNVINYKSKSISFNDYKDKLIILDFWSTFCGPCIQHMPLIYALQKEFADQVFFLPVNSNGKFDTRENVIKFLNARKKVFNLPTVVCDSVLWNLFKPPYLGVCVWIRNGKIFQITDGDAVTGDNIKKCLANVKLNVEAPITPVDYANAALYSDTTATDLPTKYYSRSLLFPFNPHIIGNARTVDQTGKVIRLFWSNATALSLIKFTNPQYSHFRERIKFNTSHSELLGLDVSTDSAKQRNLYCYEAIFPPVPYKKALEYARQDLARYFPFIVDSVRVIDSCWVIKLSRTSQIKVPKSSLRESNSGVNVGLPIYFHNFSMSSIRFDLESIFKVPVLDETGYTANLWLDNMPPDLTNINEVAKSLEKQGFTLTKEVRPIEYMVIKDLPSSN